MRELRGVVERITYQNPDSGYTVARLAPERASQEAQAARADDRLVTLVGTLATSSQARRSWPTAGGATIQSTAGSSRPRSTAPPCRPRCRA